MNYKKYQITGYQLIYGDGRRDSVKLQQTLIVADVEPARAEIKAKYGCQAVNLTYTELSL